MKYRGFLVAAAALWIAGTIANVDTYAPSELSYVGREVFVETDSAGTAVSGRAMYTYPEGHSKRLHMMSIHGKQTRSDTGDVSYRRFSTDHGRTWSEPETVATHRETPEGMLRRYERMHWVDPETGVLIAIIMQGLLPSDDPLEGMKQWRLLYRLSKDGGRSWYHEGPIVHEGDEYSEEHPLPRVHIGKNGFMVGAVGCVPIRLGNGTFLQPIQVMPSGSDGEYHNPGGGYTYTDAAVLIGAWAEDNNRVDWRISDYVKADPERSTRGMIEPTVAEMPDGRVLMVMRGSNDGKPELPGYRWYSVSEDHGQTWTEPAPWTFHEGEAFYSPSSSSQLIKHSNGRVYWLGNISPGNPRGNSPRYPLIIAEVHPESLMLIEETLCVIDEREEDDHPGLQLSNFYAREDRVTNEIAVHMTPLYRGGKHSLVQALERDPTREELLWTSDAYVYRVNVKGK